MKTYHYYSSQEDKIYPAQKKSDLYKYLQTIELHSSDLIQTGEDEWVYAKHWVAETKHERKTARKNKTLRTKTKRQSKSSKPKNKAPRKHLLLIGTLMSLIIVLGIILIIPLPSAEANQSKPPERTPQIAEAPVKLSENSFAHLISLAGKALTSHEQKKLLASPSPLTIKINHVEIHFDAQAKVNKIVDSRNNKTLNQTHVGPGKFTVRTKAPSGEIHEEVLDKLVKHEDHLLVANKNCRFSFKIEM